MVGRFKVTERYSDTNGERHHHMNGVHDDMNINHSPRPLSLATIIARKDIGDVATETGFAAIVFPRKAIRSLSRHAPVCGADGRCAARVS